LAGDVGLALVEAGRHLKGLPVSTTTRSIWGMRVSAPGIMDLRGSIPGVPNADGDLWFLDRARCRRAVAALRQDEDVAGLAVPSAGSVDDTTRWNLVIFVDRLAIPLQEVIRDVALIGRLELGRSTNLSGDDRP
jgi:hypothetical protein